MADVAGIHRATMPQARVETTDPSRLHLAGEFIESNLGSALEPDGSVTVRAIGQQYSFTPAMHSRARADPNHVARHKRRCGSRDSDPGNKYQHNAGAGYISEQSMRFEKTGDI